MKKQRDKQVGGGDKSKRRLLKRAAAAAALLAAVLLLAVFLINCVVLYRTKRRIVDIAVPAEGSADCILVLGAGVTASGTPSPMLEDRLLTGIALYERGVSDRLLFSGDHGTVDYDEVNAMKRFAVERGVPEEAIFLDHAGFSTYESLYRAKAVFGAETLVLVSQSYHLYRALDTAEQLSLEAWGVAADRRVYAGQSRYTLREALARVKDFCYARLQPKPQYLGTPISLRGDGRVTDG